jgi:hypothetical protein
MRSDMKLFLTVCLLLIVLVATRYSAAAETTGMTFGSVFALPTVSAVATTGAFNGASEQQKSAMILAADDARLFLGDAQMSLKLAELIDSLRQTQVLAADASDEEAALFILTASEL